MSHRMIFICLAVILATSPAVYAQGGFVQHGEVIGAWSMSYDMEIVDGHLYVPTLYSGLHTMDLEDPFYPVEGQRYTCGSFVNASIVEGDHLYTFGSSLIHMQITSPGHVQQVGSEIPYPFQDDFDPYFTDGAKYGDYFYLIPGNSSVPRGVQVLYAPSDESAQFLDPLEITGEKVVIHSDHAYILDARNCMYILDLSNPATPVQCGYLPRPESTNINFYDIAFAEDEYAFVGGRAGFAVVDVYNPTNPVLLHTEETSGDFVRAIALQNEILYMGGSLLYQYDISSPSVPEFISTLEIGERVYKILPEDNSVYVMDYLHGISVVDNTDPDQPELTFCQNFVGEARSIAIMDDFLFLNGPMQESNAGSNFKIYSIEDVRDPQLVTYMPMGEGTIGSVIWSMAARGDYAYVTGQMNDGTRLYTIDISDPQNPVVAGSWYNYRWLEGGIILDEDIAYVNSDVNGVWTVDISDPENPLGLGHDPMAPEYSFDFEYADQYIYVPGYNCIRVLDAQTPSCIVEVASVAIENETGATFLERERDMLFAAAYGSSMNVIDISSPEEAILVAIYPDIQVRGMASSDEKLYLISDDYNLQVYDISTATDMALLASTPVHNSHYYYYEMIADGDMVYYSDGYTIHLCEYDDTDAPEGSIHEIPDEFFVANPYPNPFNSTVTIDFSLPNAGQVQFRIYDMLGRSVYNHMQEYSMGNNSHSFNMIETGSPIASGMFFLQVDYSGVTQNRKLLLLK